MGDFGGGDNDSSDDTAANQLQNQIDSENEVASQKRAALYDERLQVVKDQLGQNFTGSGANTPLVGK